VPYVSYPDAPRSDAGYELHGEAVADPYRPLEDVDSRATSDWVTAENELTSKILEAVEGRESSEIRVRSLWDYPKLGLPARKGQYWFSTRNTGLQAQAVLWVSPTPTGDGTVLLDPNGLSEDGTVALSSVGLSHDGTLLAYAVSVGGSDWLTWRVRRVEDGADLEDELRWSKFCAASWLHDGSGFYYAAVDEPAPGEELREQNAAPHIMFHALGTAQSEDRLVFSTPDQPDWFPIAEVSEDGRFLVITVQRGTDPRTHVLVADLQVSDSEFRPLAPGFASKSFVVANTGDEFLLMTDQGAERGRVVSAHPGDDESEWSEVLGPADATLVEARVCGGRLVAHYLRDAHSVLRVVGHDRAGSGEEPASYEIDLPGLVSLVPGALSPGSIEGSRDRGEILFQVMSFTQSGALWSHDLDSRHSTLLSASAAPLDARKFVTEQVFVVSRDGTRVPMFLVRPAGSEPKGDARVLLYGYGGFDIALTPTFGVGFAGWLDRGGILAVANLRGGGEYGAAWHEAGRLANKQNVFDDFCACAAWLAESGWSRPGRIAIQGGSNGGLLVGACLTQRPELFGAAVAEVGVFDMLRFHLFTIGWAWKSDYGDPDDPEAFGWLRAYSPLHNVVEGRCYPWTLLLTGDHDDRVVPAHSYKFAATLQHAQGCANPILLRVEKSAGHGAGKPTDKLIAEAVDRLAFLDLALG
jgi:prolyl oligopeptidase